MSEEPGGEVAIDSEGDIVLARKVVREAATTLGMGLTDVTRIVTASSELARNVFRYAGRGVMHWRIVAANSRRGIELVFEDHGPGITDVDEALTEGFSTSGGMGMGLPGTRRLVDDMSIESDPGKGTVVKVRKWLR